jgi:hypothetical protein
LGVASKYSAARAASYSLAVISEVIGENRPGQKCFPEKKCAQPVYE